MRKRPFTVAQLEASKCHCCGDPAKFQWNACADGNVWRPLCPKCDIRINICVMQVLSPADWRDKIKAYAKSINFKLPRSMLK